MSQSQSYYETIQLIERLHRRFLDVLKVELDRKHIQDVNNVQAMILFNLGDDEMTVGELTIRGYYLGSNVSYNVKKMVENGYLDQERSIHDRRSVRVKVSEKGRKLCDDLDLMFQDHLTKLANAGVGSDNLAKLNKALKALESFWASQSTFSMSSEMF